MVNGFTNLYKRVTKGRKEVVTRMNDVRKEIGGIDGTNPDASYSLFRTWNFDTDRAILLLAETPGMQ